MSPVFRVWASKSYFAKKLIHFSRQWFLPLAGICNKRNLKILKDRFLSLVADITRKVFNTSPWNTEGNYDIPSISKSKRTQWLDQLRRQMCEVIRWAQYCSKCRAESGENLLLKRRQCLLVRASFNSQELEGAVGKERLFFEGGADPHALLMEVKDDFICKTSFAFSFWKVHLTDVNISSGLVLPTMLFSLKFEPNSFRHLISAVLNWLLPISKNA